MGMLSCLDRVVRLFFLSFDYIYVCVCCSHFDVFHYYFISLLLYDIHSSCLYQVRERRV